MAKEVSRNDQKIIDEAMKNMGSWYAYFADNINRYRDNKRFYFGMQWDPFVQETYIRKKKPTLVIDQIGPFIRKMQGEQKNADVSPVPIPVNTNVDQKGIDIIGGLMRRILYDNRASTIWADAYCSALVGGWGIIKVTTDYEREDSFDQYIKLECEEEPANVFFDPFSKLTTKIDGDYCGSYELMSQKDFDKMYPNCQFPASAPLPMLVPYYPVPLEDTAIIVQYYKKIKKRKTLVQLSNEMSFVKDCFIEDVEEVTMQYYAEMEQKGVPLYAIPPLKEVNRRSTMVTKIRCYKLTQYEILEKYDWPIDVLPYIFVDGDSEVIDGKQYTRSFLEIAKDAQRLYNYMMSEIAHAAKTSRRERFFLTPTQAQGHERILRQPEDVQGYLPYNPDPQAPQGPIFMNGQELPMTFLQVAQQSATDIVKTMGMMDPVTGDMPQGASGVAVGRTIANQNMTVVNYVQNLYSALQEAGRSILKLIPKIYDTQRMIVITDENGNPKPMEINHHDEFGQPQNSIPDIAEAIHDVQINVGASFAAQRQLALDFLMQLFQNPQVAPLIADLIPKELDLAIAPKLEERLQNLVPPQIMAEEQGKPPPPPPPPPPEVAMEQQKMQLQQQDLQFRQQDAQAKNQLDQQKLAQAQQQLDLDWAKAHMDAQTELQNTAMKSRAQTIKSVADLTRAHADMKAAKEKDSFS